MMRGLVDYFFPGDHNVHPAQQVDVGNPHRRLNMYKVVFWGRFGVGKSSIAALLETGDFASYNPYVIRSGFPTATLTLEDGTQVKLELWDTAGQERYHQVLKLGQLRCTDVFFIVYSPADVESFQIAKQTLESATQNTKTNPFCQYLLICSHRT